MKKAKLLRAAGIIWLVIFGIIFALSLTSIALKDGINEALWVLSSFNVASFIVNIISISPAILLFWLAGRVEKKVKSSPEETKT